MQDHHIHSFHFDDQYSTFNKFGYARGPAGEACVGDEEAFEETRGERGDCCRVSVHAFRAQPCMQSSACACHSHCFLFIVLHLEECMLGGGSARGTKTWRAMRALEGAVAVAGESMYSLGSQALAKRRKTTAERKEEEEQKRAERGAADPNEPWALEVRGRLLPGTHLMLHH